MTSVRLRRVFFTTENHGATRRTWSDWTAGPRGCEEIETSLPNGAPASGRQRKNTIRVLVPKRRDRFTHSLSARQRMNIVRLEPPTSLGSFGSISDKLAHRSMTA